MKRHLSFFPSRGVVATPILSSCATATQPQSTDVAPQMSGFAMPVLPRPALSPSPTPSPAVTETLTWAGPITPVKDEVLGILPADCMHQAGYADEKTNRDHTAPAPKTQVRGSSRRVFNEELAKEYGYHCAPDQQLLIEAYEEDTDPVRRGIERNRIGYSLENGPYDPVEGAQNAGLPITTADLYFATAIDPDAEETLAGPAQKWRECMASLGIHDLPFYPWDDGLTIPSLTEKWDRIGPIGTPLADEIVVATHDAQCRRTSGWASEFDELSWNRQQQFIDEHREELRPLALLNEDEARKSLEIIQRLQTSGT